MKLSLGNSGFAHIFMILLLLGGLSVGVYLVQQQQTFYSQATPSGGGPTEGDDGVEEQSPGEADPGQENPTSPGDGQNDPDNGNGDKDDPDESHENEPEQESNSDENHENAPSQAQDDDGNLVVANHILVKFIPGDFDRKSEQSKIVRKYKGKVLEKLGVYLLTVSPSKRVELTDELNKNPVVNYAESNFITKFSQIVPNDPEYNLSQYGLRQIKAPFAWEVTKGNDAMVAVIDTGVNPQHPDLAGKIALNYNFLTNSTVALDDNGHGTHVAGIIAANTNNSVGISGVSWNNRIMNLKVLNQSGLGTDTNISKAIIFAVDNGAKVINLSLGRTAYSATLESAVNYATSRNVVVVAAAGNYGTTTPVFPASYDKVLAVSATDATDNKASFSSFGDWVDLAAPGVQIQSTSSNNGYEKKDGTSMSAPYVAGAAALVWANGATSSDDVIAKLKGNADDIGENGFDLSFGAGRLNIAGSVGRATTVSVTPPPSSVPFIPTPTPTNTYNEPLNIDIVTPENKQVISRKDKIRINIRTSDNIMKVEFLYDNQIKCTDEKRPFKCNLKNRKPNSEAGDIPHIITVKAYDKDGEFVQESVEVIYTKDKVKTKTGSQNDD